MQDLTPVEPAGAVPATLSPRAVSMPAVPLPPPRPVVGRFVVVGLIVGLMFFGVLGAWASLVPLASAALASGTVRAEGNRRTVQHLEGGLIRELMIKEGDVVQRGQILIRLDRTLAETRFDAMQSQYDLLKATQSRLLAERARSAVPTFPVELEDRRNDPRIGTILVGQEQIFRTRRQSYDGQKGILKQRNEQLRSQIDGLKAQVASSDRQLALIRSEAGNVAELLAKNLERQPRLLDLQRRAAALEGDRAQSMAQIAQAMQQIGETDLRIMALDDDQNEKIATELRDTEADLNRVEEELTAAADVLRRRDIRAPIAGTVMNLRFFTPGGVIQPGSPIMELVPKEDRLLIEAQINPLDIDIIRPGLKAEVQLTAYKQRRVPVLDGQLIQLSADRVVDEKTGMAYYKGLVAIDAQELREVHEVELYPGMPTEVMIRTGDRTFLSYLTQPLRDSFHRAFLEP